MGSVELIRGRVIDVRQGMERLDGSDAVFSDGRRQAFDAVMLAAGYRAGLPRSRSRRARAFAGTDLRAAVGAARLGSPGGRPVRHGRVTLKVPDDAGLAVSV